MTCFVVIEIIAAEMNLTEVSNTNLKLDSENSQEKNAKDENASVKKTADVVADVVMAADVVMVAVAILAYFNNMSLIVFTTP